MTGVQKRLTALEKRLSPDPPPKIVVIWDAEEEAAALEEAQRRGDTIIRVEWADDPPEGVTPDETERRQAAR